MAYTAVAGDDKQPADPGLTIAQKLAKYEQFGLEYQEINKAEGIQRSIYYQGQLLKGFVDVQPGGAVFSVKAAPNKERRTLCGRFTNEQGELSGLRLATPEELAAEMAGTILNLIQTENFLLQLFFLKYSLNKNIFNGGIIIASKYSKIN